MPRYIGLTGLLLAAVLTCAYGDTIVFRDGTEIHGKVSKPNNDTVVIQIGNGKTTFAAVDIASIEKNDKASEVPNVSQVQAKMRQDYLQQRTGLNRKQRDAVRDAMAPLWSPDEATRNAAREKLVAMNGEMSVYKFVASSLPYMKGELVPELMRALVEMDPENARVVLSRRKEDPDPRNRAQAIRLMAQYDEPDGVQTVVRGLIDQESQVQIAATDALVQMGAKEATPVLLEALQGPDPKVRSACRQALKSLWSTEDQEVDFESANEWKGFWNTRASNVKGAVNPDKLNPLVTAEDLEHVTSDFDE